MVAVPNNMRFVYKRSLSWVPFWGWSMYLNRFIPVNRENPLSAIKSLKQAARILKNKFSINIFPEGTRSIDGNVSEFKRGFFLIASESGKKVVPVSIKGTRNILAKKSYNISGGVVNIKFSNPVDFDSKDKLFAQKIREIISSNL
jgi:1-acyl-sn-glycerol-3-phosphate acyltransferase